MVMNWEEEQQKIRKIQKYWKSRGLDGRIALMLGRQGIETEQQIKTLSINELKKTPNFGKKSINDLVEFCIRNKINAPKIYCFYCGVNKKELMDLIATLMVDISNIKKVLSETDIYTRAKKGR